MRSCRPTATKSGVSFEIAEPTGILQEARSRAIRDAKRRAEVYAQVAGVTMGQVKRITEQPINPPRPMAMPAEFRTAAENVPMAAGEQEYRVTVTVAYKLLSAEDAKMRWNDSAAESVAETGREMASHAVCPGDEHPTA